MPSAQNGTVRSTILSLLLVIAIDCMGFGFIFPVLTPLFLQGHHAIVPAGISIGMRDFLYGAIVAAYPLCMLFGAPILGDLSDYMGRKMVLMICLIGTCIGYLISGIGISYNMFIVVALGRILDGLTAGSLPLAQAAIADVSRNSPNQAKYMGMMMFAIAAGQVMGPLFAGVFSDQAISSHFGFSAPFYAITILTILNIIWLQVAFSETYTVDKSKSLSITKTLKSFQGIFSVPRLLYLSVIFTCMQLSWSFYSQASPAYLQAMFSYNSFQLGLFSAGLGLFIAVGGTFIMPRLLKSLTTKQTAFLGLVLLGLGLVVGIVLVNQILFWLGLIITAIGAAIAFSLIVTLFSESVDETKQGWIMGWTGAIIAAAWTVSAICTGILMSVTTSFALWVATIIAAVGCYFMWKFTKRFPNSVAE